MGGGGGGGSMVVLLNSMRFAIMHTLGHYSKLH